MAAKGQRKLTYEENPLGEGNGGHADKTKVERTRRSWTRREEEALLVALHDLVAGGWKSDNGFRNGYANRVFQVMKREIPDTELKVSPHLNSKITMWKCEYGSLCLILDRSGIGFNSNNDYKIECNDEQWAQIVKADSAVKTMRNKSWPYWEDWKSIFGKDSGNGLRAEDLTQADEQLNGNPTSVADESHPSMAAYTVEDFYTPEQIEEAVNVQGTPEVVLADGDTKSVRSPSFAKKSTRKRKAEDVFETMLEVMTKIHEDTSERLQTLSSRIGYDFDLSLKRIEINKMLDEIPLLPQKHRFMALDILVKEPERLDLFSGFSVDDKYDYIIHILEEKHGV